MRKEIDPANPRKDDALPDHKTPAKPSLSEAMERLPANARDRVADVAERMQKRTPSPSMRLSWEGDTLAIEFEAERAEIAMLLQMADIGTTDDDFRRGLISQIACLGSQGRKVDSGNSNFVFSVVRSVQPRDELEAMLAAQMGAIHSATMMLARRLNLVETIPQQDAAERALNKLGRTFAMQMEALKRYRSTGQQKVTVEHVTVNAGGQAIVGAVAPPPRAST
jgi:hypothetical protein